MPDFTTIDMHGIGARDQSTLECNHCGDVAAHADPDTDQFTDGQGADEGCTSCGFPGHVSVDEVEGAYWVESDLPNARCDRDDCEECGTWRGEHFGAR